MKKFMVLCLVVMFVVVGCAESRELTDLEVLEWSLVRSKTMARLGPQVVAALESCNLSRIQFMGKLFKMTAEGFLEEANHMEVSSNMSPFIDSIIETMEVEVKVGQLMLEGDIQGSTIYIEQATRLNHRSTALLR